MLEVQKMGAIYFITVSPMTTNIVFRHHLGNFALRKIKTKKGSTAIHKNS
jgi:hypothetical protein